jgi:pimeloyl-ACP methyl ester carboxylesterase
LAASPITEFVVGAHGLRLVADRWPAPGRRPVVLLHGGGQTRHAWGETGARLAGLGYDVTSLDLRGHGDSAWSSDGHYRMDDFRDDLIALLDRRESPAVVIGASLGGVAALLACGEGAANRVKSLVLVDITHRIAADGASRIQAFMSSNHEGFASLEEAAEAVAGYLPHRPRPRDPSGLMKNLRERQGRLFWHWDPGFLAITAANRGGQGDRLERAAASLAIPTLLVRGGRSEIVSPEDARAFLDLVTHAELAEVDGAAHMVAGDDNSRFGAALFDFLARAAPPSRM